MTELHSERGRKIIPKIIALTLATLAIPACSKAGNSPGTVAPEREETIELPTVEFPEVIWGPEYVDVTENATVDCSLAEIYATNANSIYFQYYASRPWFISGSGTVEEGYQRGGYVGNSTETDLITNEVKDGWYIHRGADNTFGIYETTAQVSTSNEGEGASVDQELRFIERFTLDELGEYNTRTYENDSVVLSLTPTDDLPHYYDADTDSSFLYPPLYPQRVSGDEEGPGLAVDVQCKVPGRTIESPTESSGAATEIV